MRGSVVLALVFAGSVSAAQELVPGPYEGTQPDPIRFRLVDVSGAVGLSSYPAVTGMGMGMAAADHDDDGDVDVFVPTGGADRLYRNLGGTFEEVAGPLGLASTANNRVGLWFDHDGDHDLDLVTGNDDLLDSTSYRLNEQGPLGTFADVTAGSGLDVYAMDDEITHRGGMCAGDVDNDGFLDLYCGSWVGQQRLFLNQSDGTFVEIGASSGIGIFESQWQPIMVDIDRDGWMDVYVAVDFTANRLWINQGDLTFVDVARSAQVDVEMNDMGNYVIDYDDDGDLDFYTTNVESYDEEFGLFEYNALLENRTGPHGVEFQDVTKVVGVGRGSWGWGTTIFDADNDGIVEFASTNGFTGPRWRHDRSRLWKRLHPASAEYTEIGRIAGLDDRLWGSSLLSADVDRDGDLDLLQSSMDGIPRLLVNLRIGPPAHYLVVRPRMEGANHRALGATVTIVVGARTSARLITAGTSFLGQEPAEAFFGLGSAETVDLVRVEFPDGTSVNLTGVQADQVLTVTP